MASGSFSDSLEASDLPEGIYSLDDVVIAIMGVTGAGKSSFIKMVTGRDDIVVGHDLTSETLECKAYHFRYGNIKFALVDTPGFNDTHLDDAAVLAQLAAFMERTYRVGLKLTAIIYLHPIVNYRLEGSALDNLSMFRRLCGPDCFSNIVLATSLWSHVDPEIGACREAELKNTEEFWGAMLQSGSDVIRLPDSRAESISLLLRLAQKNKMVLQIQQELVEQGLPITETDAGASSRNTQALAAFREEISRRVLEMREQSQAELRRQQLLSEERIKEDERLLEESLRSYQEELEKNRRLQQETLRKAEEQRRQILLAKTKQIREVEVENARLQGELQLTLEVEERSTFQSQIERLRLKKGITVERLNAQKQLFSRARACGQIRATIESDACGFIRYCDSCNHSVSVQLSYRCTLCGDYDLCKTCFDAGKWCKDKQHKQLIRRSLVGTDVGQCRRAKKPPADRHRVPCDRCGNFVNGIYYHCCKCRSDNYDICVDCIAKGALCLNIAHRLSMRIA